MPRPIKKLPIKDNEPLNRVQDLVIPPINALLFVPTLDGRLVEADLQGKALAVGVFTLLVAHGLGRVCRGWQMTDIDAVASVWQDTPASNPDPTKFLALRANAPANIKLWVF